MGGKFLECTKVPKGGTKDNPIYYTASDLYLEAILDIFKHRFIIKDADEYVLKYMEARPEEFSKEAIDAMKKRHSPKS